MSCNCQRCQQRNAPFVLNGATFNPVPVDESDMLPIPTIDWGGDSDVVNNVVGNDLNVRYEGDCLPVLTINWSVDPHGRKVTKVPPPFAKGEPTDNESETDMLPIQTIDWSQPV